MVEFDRPELSLGSFKVRFGLLDIRGSLSCRVLISEFAFNAWSQVGKRLFPANYRLLKHSIHQFLGSKAAASARRRFKLSVTRPSRWLNSRKKRYQSRSYEFGACSQGIFIRLAIKLRIGDFIVDK